MAMDDRESSTTDRMNELEAIKGIGPTFARALNKVGVTQLTDLIYYTPDELAHALAEQAGVKVTPERIASDDWIGQAQRIVEQTAGGGEEMANTESEEDAGQAAWRQRAGFSLFFDYVANEQSEPVWQTRVYHDESGEEAQFVGVEATSWVNWVLERAQLSEADSKPPDSATSGVEEVPAAMEANGPPAHEEEATVDAMIDILDVQVGELDLSMDVSEKQLLTEIYFQVVGADAPALSAERAPYRVEVRAIDLETGRPISVQSRQDALQPDALEGIVRLELPLPELGRYKLHSVLQLLPPADLFAFYEGPTLKIVP